MKGLRLLSADPQIYSLDQWIIPYIKVPRFKLWAVHRRRRNFLAVFHTPPPCWNFDSDLANFCLMIFCDIGISGSLPP